jgi:hypothetical protein
MNENRTTYDNLLNDRTNTNEPDPESGKLCEHVRDVVRTGSETSTSGVCFLPVLRANKRIEPQQPPGHSQSHLKTLKLSRCSAPTAAVIQANIRSNFPTGDCSLIPIASLRIESGTAIGRPARKSLTQQTGPIVWEAFLVMKRFCLITRKSHNPGSAASPLATQKTRSSTRANLGGTLSRMSTFAAGMMRSRERPNKGMNNWYACRYRSLAMVVANHQITPNEVHVKFPELVSFEKFFSLSREPPIGSRTSLSLPPIFRNHGR